MARGSSSLYDQQITVFSPEGKLFQVEYAFRAVEAANVTVVALRGRDAVVIVGQRKVSSQALAQDKLLDPSSLSSLHPVTKSIGGAFVGLPADCRVMRYQCQQKAATFKYENGFDVPLSYLTQKIANLNQVFTQHAYMRLHACVGILIGVDDIQGNAPQLYKFDPAGWYTGNRAAVVGNKSTEATNHFEKLLRKGEPTTESETIQEAIICLQQTLGLEFKASDLEIGLVTRANPVFRCLSEEEVDDYLTQVAERD